MSFSGLIEKYLISGKHNKKNMQILKDVLVKVKVAPEELMSIRQNAEKFRKELAADLKKEGLSSEVVIGGSLAKGTIIKGDFDCDIFVRFENNNNNLSNLLEKVLKKHKPHRVHGSRDYFQLIKDNIQYEIVPVLKVKNQKDAKNVTDMSPMHVSWIKKKLTKNPPVIDEIILAKTFCKANRIYGAESYIGGFSGHVLDILVVYYGSFINLLKAAKKWQIQTVIDVEAHGNKKELNKSKLSPLIVFDPVDKTRNAAAALTNQKLELFKRTAAEFLNKPSKSFFIKKKITEDSLKKLKGNNQLILVKLTPLKGKRDVVGAKLLKCYEHIKKHLEKNEFNLKKSGWEWDKDALIWFILDKAPLTKEQTRIGPPLHEKKSAQNFMEKHASTYVKEDRLYAKIKREYTMASKLISNLINSRYIKTRTKLAIIK